LDDRSAGPKVTAPDISDHKTSADWHYVHDQSSHFADHPGKLRFINSSVLKNPAYTAVSAVTCAVLGNLLKSPTREKVSFIYDENLVTRAELASGYRSLLKRLPKYASDLVAYEPQFQDDKEFRPLQAADLFAYYFGRKTFLISQGKDLESAIWDAMSEINCIDASVDENDLRRMTQDAIAAVEKRFGVRLLPSAPFGRED